MASRGGRRAGRGESAAAPRARAARRLTGGTGRARRRCLAATPPRVHVWGLHDRPGLLRPRRSARVSQRRVCARWARTAAGGSRAGSYGGGAPGLRDRCSATSSLTRRIRWRLSPPPCRGLWWTRPHGVGWFYRLCHCYLAQIDGWLICYLNSEERPR